ncbi:MAG TPA: cation-transporting P-type ATPase [Candidatus Baltobacterales bacterium]|nr:cation-transporting P-type ATPase [Candidatus Baltobacterales bacterium]
MATPAAVTPAFHALDVEASERELDSDRHRGLSSAEAAARLARFGRNELVERGRGSFLRQLVEQLTDPLVILLVLAAAISGILLGQRVDAVVIVAIVVLNGTLGLVQQFRAERALDRLRELAAPAAAVIREGSPRRIAAAELVPGDLIEVHAGDRVPADARVFEAHHLSTAESMLTGEPFPEDKGAVSAPVDAPLADRTSMIYMGTTVATGRGMAMVTGTAAQTAMGQIAGLLAVRRPPTPLQRELTRLGRLLSVAALGIVAVLFAVGWLQGFVWHEMFMTSVALAVAAVPESLPAVVTITLARGVQRLAAQSAIVRRLQAVETLGAATVICTDKTGTLTRNRIAVQEVAFQGAQGWPPELDAEDSRIKRFAHVAALCNDAVPGVAGGDPVETALLESLSPLALDVSAIRADHPRLDEAAFDSRRKLMSTLHVSEAKGRLLLAVKGAAEVVISRSVSIETAHGALALDAAGRQRLMTTTEDLARRGLRTLGIAYRLLPGRANGALSSAEHELTLVAIVGFSDEIRPEAARAVAAAQRAGIQVVMITGDHAETAAAVGRELEIMAPGHEVLPGERLSRLTSDQLAGEVRRYTAYSRVDPADKVKIVQAWQRQGEIVAMTGDGVNDAPALRTADIGVAMGSGSDVSREAAAIVLADDNFATLVAAVREGRGIFENLQNVIRFLLTTNASEVIVMAVGFIAFGYLGEPLLPTQILWINLVSDGLPVLALAADTPRHDVMRRQPVRRRALLDAREGWALLWRAAILAAAALGGLVYGHYIADAPWARVQTIVFTTLVGVQLGYSLAIRVEGRRHPLRGSGLLLWAVVSSLVLQVAVVILPPGQHLLHTVPLTVADWMVLIALTLVAVLAAHRMPVFPLRHRSA